MNMLHDKCIYVTDNAGAPASVCAISIPIDHLPMHYLLHICTRNYKQELFVLTTGDYLLLCLFMFIICLSKIINLHHNICVHKSSNNVRFYSLVMYFIFISVAPIKGLSVFQTFQAMLL